MVVPTTASFRDHHRPSTPCGAWKVGLFFIFLLASGGFFSILGFGIFSDDDYDGPNMPPKLTKKPARMALDLEELEDLHRGDEIDELSDFEGRDQEDPELIKFIQAEYLIRPSPRHEPYGLKNKYHIDSALGSWVRSFFKEKRGLVFVEAGASDGETLDNTLSLEMELGWSGVLIECNPKATPDLVSGKRKSWIAIVCISDNNKAQKVTMSIPETKIYDTRLARVGPSWDFSHFGVDSKWTTKEGMDAVPLYSILKAVGLKQIDYLSLDVEGIEVQVLKNFPFDKIFIKVVIVDVYFYSYEEKSALRAFMKTKGYAYVRTIQVDQIYVHESLLKDPDVEIGYFDEL